MAVYKPTQCYPFAGAIDITKTFCSIARDANGDWGAKRPEAVYLTGRIETNNSLVVGYNVRLLLNDEVLFENPHFSPISELPRFEDDKTINTGVNGTYFAIPVFQCGGEAGDLSNYVTLSYNALYSGLSDDEEVEGSTLSNPNVVGDYLIGEDDTSGAAYFGNWTFDSSDDTYSYDGDWDGRLGGCLVTEDDVVVFADYDNRCRRLCYLDAANKKLVVADDSVFTTTPQDYSNRSLFYIKKGKQAGLYSYYDDDSGRLVHEGGDLNGRFYSFSGPVNEVAGFFGGQLAWEVSFLQGPEDVGVISDLVDNSDIYEIDMAASNITDKYYDMVVTTGTILGSNAKRLQLSSSFQENGEYVLPGHGLQTQPVLTGSFCEILYSDSLRMSPSFPIANYDASFGHVYPREGYISQKDLENFIAKGSGDLYARFYKYSSNSDDVLSNEKARLYFNNTANYIIDPEKVLVAGYSGIDGISLNPGDRVLWNSNYDSGHKNGIWVVNGTGNATRPADGDAWADYIGKVVLITEGTYANVVVESNATAGSFELGSSSLYFFEQKPLPLFDSAYPDDVHVREALTDVNVLDYISTTPIGFDPQTGAPTGWDTTAQPVPGTPSGDAFADNFILMRLVDNTYNTTSGAVTGTRIRTVRVNLSPIDHTPRGAAPSSTGGIAYNYLYKNPVTQAYSVYTPKVVGEVISDETSYYVEEGISKGERYKSVPLAGGYVTGSRTWEPLPSVNMARIIFNTTTKTCVSPSTSIGAHQHVSLQGGKTVVDSSGNQLSTLNIQSFDPRFNMITHTELSEPISAADDAFLGTPYKYDIVTPYAVSGLNGVSTRLPNVPYIEPAYASGDIVAGWSSEVSGFVFSSDFVGWSESRYVLQMGGPDEWQDTGWFGNGSLQCEFNGLGEGESYPLILYTKDKYDRITQETRLLRVPSGAPFDFSATPMARTGSGSPYIDRLTIKCRVGREDLGCDAEYLYSLAASSAAADPPRPITADGYTDAFVKILGIGFVTPGPAYAFTDVGDEVEMEFRLKGAAGDLYVAPRWYKISMPTPNGWANLYFHFPTTGAPNTDYQSDNWFIRADEDNLFRGTFPGALSATPDPSTGSVMLTYAPPGYSSGWPGCLPFCQNGSLSVYKREYSEFRADGCDAVTDGAVWYGFWEPVAINYGGPTLRDFDVRQGHSYQYAIMPTADASLLTETEALDGSVVVYASASTESSNTVVTIPITVEGMGLVFDSNHAATNATISVLKDGTAVAPTSSGVYFHGDGSVGDHRGFVRFTISGHGASYRTATYQVRVTVAGATYAGSYSFVEGELGSVSPYPASSGAPAFPAFRKMLLANGGDPVYVCWDSWSITALDEVDPSTLWPDRNVRHPAVQKAYAADLDNVWLLRYDAEPGSQNLNLTRNEISTLAKKPRFSSGALNAESGSMTCWLGSEIIKGTRLGYAERRRRTHWAPLATNEAAATLAAWRAFVADDRPKLLKDRKGRSWIVQISDGGSNQTMDNFVGTPTKISFSWKEIDEVGRRTIIWGDGDELPEMGGAGWAPVIVTRR